MRNRGFTLIEVMIVGILFAILSLAALGVLTQAQRGIRETAVRTDIGERGRKVLDEVTREIRESSIALMVAGYKSKVSGSGEVRNYIQLPSTSSATGATEPDVVSCTDQYCPFVWNGTPSGGNEINPSVRLARLVRLQTGSFTGTSLTSGFGGVVPTVMGRMWLGLGPAGAPCAEKHSVPSNTLAQAHVGAILFATARNSRGQFVSIDGADVSPDWQGLVFYATYATGANVMELRRYVFYIDDLVRGDNATLDALIAVASPGVTTTTTSGTGPSFGAFNTNKPAGKPTLLDLLDADADGRTDDGCYDFITGITGADASDETLDIVQPTTNGPSFIVYSKKGTGPSGRAIDFSISIDRKTGDLVVAVNNQYGSVASSPAYVKTVQVTGRSPTTIAARVTDIAFDTALNCPYDATNNPSGLEIPTDQNTVRVTAHLDKVITEGGSTLSAGEVVWTKVQPRN
ncbi:MAG: prepilin-type N-terminal cleavage/methylation domain-containing protein [Planctomycetales bacterium]|nr:prepilin-type N-terminal cleavage/methylation domain-containing protein [Planctomycetales bacterium]